MDNQMVLVGNLTRDPELRFLPSGKSVVSFSIAHSTRRRVEGGGWEDGKTSFFDLTAWEKLGENLVASAKKGDRLVVLARAQQDTWEIEGVDGAEPQKRSKVTFTAEEIGISIRWATAEPTKNERSSSPSFGDPVPDAVLDEEPF